MNKDQENKEIQKLKAEIEVLLEFVEEVSDRINPQDENLARFHFYGKTLLKEFKAEKWKGK